jgi:hypothetical protein
VRHGIAGLAISIACFACGGGGDPPPPTKQPPPAAKQEEAFAGFHFAPTFERHTPAGTKLTPLAEVSLPHAAKMKAVVATHREDRNPALQVELWTFEQRAEDNIVAPLEGPAPLLQLDARAPDSPELEALRRDLAAPRVVVGRPQGLDVGDALQALERMHQLAQSVRDEAAPPQERLDATAEFVRGLDDDLWLSQQRVPWLLDLLAEGPWTIVGDLDGTDRRTRMRAKPGEGKPEYSLAFLRKRDGWVLQEFEQRR